MAVKSYEDAFNLRYQAPQDAFVSVQLSETANTILSHKSTRRFLRDRLLPNGTLEALVAAGQSASTSSLLQTWSVVSIEDPERKDQIATLAGNQQFIRDAPLFMLFCADLSRLTNISKDQQAPAAALKMTDMFVMSTVDAALAGQNVSTVAESLGLGICYVGAARNNAERIAELLSLPERVYGVFGMAIGWPDETQTPAIKPRLGQRAVLHREAYSTDQTQAIESYDKALKDFYDSQKKSGRKPWSSYTAEWLATDDLDGREALRQFLRKQDFQFN